MTIISSSVMIDDIQSTIEVICKKLFTFLYFIYIHDITVT